MNKFIFSLLFIGVLAMSAHAGDKSPQIAIFSGGCFWSAEKAFEHLPGVSSTEVGYTGGHVANPTYEQVSAENTGHFESVKVTFDPAKITYEQLLDVYWHSIDPLDPKGQFCDRGSSYQTAIFYSSPEQQKIAEASKKKMEAKLDKPIMTQIRATSEFFPAEDYHQKYADKNPMRYSLYRNGCGRDERLAEVWGADEKKK
jgi:peptide-methionine (S)-S-oxide reductase